MMNENKAPEREAVLNATGVENGRDSDQLSNDKDILDRRFSVTDLWSMRRNIRKFQIHNRIARL